jgi:hypothetical protein
LPRQSFPAAAGVWFFGDWCFGHDMDLSGSFLPH